MFVKYRDRGKLEEPTHVGQTAVVVEDVDNDGMTCLLYTSLHGTSDQWEAPSVAHRLPTRDTAVPRPSGGQGPPSVFLFRLIPGRRSSRG